MEQDKSMTVFKCQICKKEVNLENYAMIYKILSGKLSIKKFVCTQCGQKAAYTEARVCLVENGIMKVCDAR
jgi:uncharacterized protein YlaI